MRRVPRLTRAEVRWVWTLDPPGPSAPVPEEWVIPPLHGPLPLSQEVIVEVESFSPEHQRAATATVSAMLHSIFITARGHFFANMHLTWMAIHGGQFARIPVLLLGTASCS